ncbi:MAG: ATP-dependent protease LonB, partial [Candidatus Micrarchaeia archaeon]
KYGNTIAALILGIFILAAMWLFTSKLGAGMMRREELLEPKLLVDNTGRRNAPFVEATGAKAGALFGDVKHDPLQTGGLGTPPHLRVEAGAVHRANKGVLYLDEIGTLSPKSQQDLLSAMQEKKFPITGQSEMSSGALTRTEPVPCDFVLAAAGNLQVLQHMHPALRSRIRGYGYEIYLNDTIPDIPENRAKIARFVAQEVKKDGKIPHFTRNAVHEVIMEARKRAGRKGKLSLKLREIGGLIRAAGDIAREENVNLVDVDHVRKALSIAQTAEQQIADQLIEVKREYSVLTTEGYEIGKVNGLAVIGEYGGLVMPLVAEVTPASSRFEGKVIATGKLGKIAKEAVANVSAVIKKYMRKDVTGYDIHIQFLQTYEGLEGDSASISVALAVLSAMECIPVRQDTAMTGSLSVRGEVLPVGGITAKIEAAISSGIKRVVIPKGNIEDIALPKEKLKGIEIIPADTIIDVIDAALKEGRGKQKLIQILKKEFRLDGKKNG